MCNFVYLIFFPETLPLGEVGFGDLGFGDLCCHDIYGVGTGVAANNLHFFLVFIYNKTHLQLFHTVWQGLVGPTFDSNIKKLH